MYTPQFGFGGMEERVKKFESGEDQKSAVPSFRKVPTSQQSYNQDAHLYSYARPFGTIELQRVEGTISPCEKESNMMEATWYNHLKMKILSESFNLKTEAVIFVYEPIVSNTYFKFLKNVQARSEPDYS